MIYFVIFELGRGFLTMFIYVLLRPRLDPGVRTAAWAGLVTWAASIVAAIAGAAACRE